MVASLLEKLPTDYDNIMVITRGGMVPACLISEKTNIRNILVAAVMFYEGEQRSTHPVFLQFPADTQVRDHKILVVDDVWDTGSTVMAVRERLLQAEAKPEIAVLHYKPSRSLFPSDAPNYWAEETDAWIVYPWDPERKLSEKI
jgi:hypoxanthine phosphoribosyltransferase